MAQTELYLRIRKVSDAQYNFVLERAAQLNVDMSALLKVKLDEWQKSDTGVSAGSLSIQRTAGGRSKRNNELHVRNVPENLFNYVIETCKKIGISRTAFMRFKINEWMVAEAAAEKETAERQAATTNAGKYWQQGH